jgi:hypothetical protein
VCRKKLFLKTAGKIDEQKQLTKNISCDIFIESKQEKKKHAKQEKK